jgi:y4mF family transcriptional regulator
MTAAPTKQTYKDVLSGIDETPRAMPQLMRSIDQIGRAIAARRKERGYTQQEFADLVGVGKRFIVDIEAGKQTAEIGKVLLVLNNLGLDLLVRPR